jgi:rod shape determining protein RodA
MQASRAWRHFDVWLFAGVALLTIAGVAMIQSAIAGNEFLVDQDTVVRQVIFGLAGLVVLVLFTAIDYRLWSALSRPMYLFILAILALIPIAGIAGFGSARWFQVGIITVQPSELAKIIMTLVLANYLSRNQHRLHESGIVIRSLLLIAVPALLVFIQPDLSTAIVLGVIWIAQVWAAGGQPKHLAILAGIALLAPILAWPLLQDYQQARVITFLFPDPDAGFGATYNVNQALIAIGSGGLFGKGYGSGTQVQLRFLKVRHTDFIFSAMSEEFGFVGAMLLLLLFSFIIYRCLRAARMARDTFGALTCYGVAILMLFQGFFNIGMNLKLFPVSGLPLPFFSYGGSSLFTSLLAIGLVESVILRHKQIEL